MGQLLASREYVNSKISQKEMVPEGVEPSTLALLAPHSNQLSYGTVV